MVKQISYPKIPQFRNVVHTIRKQSSFVSFDEEGNPIIDETLPKPKLIFEGTVKLHGTNAGVCLNSSGFWAQSRKNVITVNKDNAGFAFFVDANETHFKKIMYNIAEYSGIDLKENTLSLYGEWVGKNIQKGVSISNLDKSFFLFGIKVSPHNDWENSYWINSDINIKNFSQYRIFNIKDYPTWSIEIDFSYPELAQSYLEEITRNVEACCPVAKRFGFDGVGEGVVWTGSYKGVVHRFKVKGEKHSVSKVKTLAPVDVEKLSNIRQFVDYSVTENRFNQGVKEVFGNENVDIKKLGQLIKWVIQDINSEESDVMVENGLYPKDVNKYIAPKVKEMFNKLI